MDFFKIIIALASLYFSTIAQAVEYDSDYTGKPGLKIFYGNHRKKAFPIDVHEGTGINLADQNIIQSFDLKITRQKGNSPYLFIGIYKGLRLNLQSDGCILMHHGQQGYLVKSQPRTLTSEIDYHVKISYDKDALYARCIITRKDNSKKVWDSGEVLCDPLFPLNNIHFSARYFPKDTANCKSEILWDEKNGMMLLRSEYKNWVLEALVDNMKVVVK
jgi:hypothetical protein